MVKDGWEAAGSSDLLSKITTCSNYLQRWGGGKTKNFNNVISDLKMQLRKLKALRDQLSLKKKLVY